jgi:hypothetical protein
MKELDLSSSLLTTTAQITAHSKIKIIQRHGRVASGTTHSLTPHLGQKWLSSGISFWQWSQIIVGFCAQQEARYLLNESVSLRVAQVLLVQL